MSTRNEFRAIDSIFLLALLTGLYPGLFVVSNNWFLIGPAQSFYVLLSLVSAALFAISVPYFLFSYLRTRESIVRNVLPGISVFILAGYFDFLIVDLQDKYEVDVRGVIFIAVGTVACYLQIRSWVKDKKLLDFVRPFNIGLSIMTSLAFFSLLISVLLNYQKFFFSFSTNDKKAVDIYNDVRFKFYPNIYLIIPDSYPSNRLLEQFFHFDNSKFSVELQSLGFRIYDDYFSSYPYSTESVHSLFSMTHNYFKKSTGDDTIGLREVIAGRNDVINILRNNGYKSIFIHQTDYLFKENCFLERCLPELSAYDRLRENLQNFYLFDRLPATRRKYSAAAEMKKQIAKTREGSRTFIYGHFMKAHSKLKTFERQHERLLPQFREAYAGRITNANRLLSEQVRQILDQDPSAVIVIVGDHGTWAGADRTDTGLSENETLDRFSVFLAIKWGTAYNGQYDHQIKSSVNLFRYVFAHLSQSETILETRVNDESFVSHNGVWKVIQDGKVLPSPEYYSPEP